MKKLCVHCGEELTVEDEAQSDTGLCLCCLIDLYEQQIEGFPDEWDEDDKSPEDQFPYNYEEM